MTGANIQTVPAAGARRFAHVLGALAIGFILALPFTLTLALGNNLSHDEHQHIAAGALLAREGLQPYRDFAYFHVPYLVWTYGALFQWTEQLVLATRLFSAACAALTCAVVFAAAWFILAQRPWPLRLLIAIGATATLLSSPVFSATVGHSWNQEPSVMFVVLSFGALLCASRDGHLVRYMLAAGLLTGLAAGFRVTMLPMVLPFAVMAWLTPTERGRGVRWQALAWYAVGVTVALLPMAFCLLTAREGFLFGNVEFPKVNIAYRFAVGEPRTMTVAKKLRFLFKLVMRPNWLPTYGFLAALALVWVYARDRVLASRPSFFVLLALPFLLLGALAPSPVFDQYFYSLPPFLIIGAVAALDLLPMPSAACRAARWSTAGAAVVFGAMGIGRYHRAGALLRPRDWAAKEIHATAAKLRDAVGPNGKILTLSPTLAVEGGLRIYPELATGPFGFRVAPYVSTNRHQRLHLLAPEAVAAFLANDPPDAVLTGGEVKIDTAFEEYALAHHYESAPFAGRYKVWLSPKNVGVTK